MKDLIKVIQQEAYEYSDPITQVWGDGVERVREGRWTPLGKSGIRNKGAGTGGA